MTTTSTFRKLISAFTACLVVLTMASAPLLAQQYTLSNTTLSGSITATATSLILASASASAGSSFGAPAVGQCLFVDAELMRITAVSSTTMTVQRGRTPMSHLTAAVIFTGSCNAFKAAEPNLGNNAVCSAQPAPWINVNTGNIWWCNTFDNKWRGTNFATFAYNSVPVLQ